MAGSQHQKGYIRNTLQGMLSMDDQKYLTMTSYIRNFFSEMFGTGLLVFLGCMGVKTGEPHLGVAFSFGISAFIAIQICCHNSGGHINPALTLVGIVFEKISVKMGIVYILGQVIGAILGFGLLLAVTPGSADNFCITVPRKDMSDSQAFFFEAIMTAALMLVVCSIWDPKNGTLLDSATLKFGFAIFALAFAGGSYTGCSMNPARSFGPAVWLNKWEKHWVYWIGPSVGALVAAYIYKLFFCGPLKPTPPVTVRDNKIEMETVTSS